MVFGHRKLPDLLFTEEKISPDFDDIFFFKQKTAYEIMSGDWSSDVCSSDLLNAKTLIRKTIFHEKFRRGRHRQSQIGDRKSVV